MGVSLSGYGLDTASRRTRYDNFANFIHVYVNGGYLMSESVNTIASKKLPENQRNVTVYDAWPDSARLELIGDWTQEYYSNDSDDDRYSVASD